VPAKCQQKCDSEKLDETPKQLGHRCTLHTFDEYVHFHPHLHAIVVDGLFTGDGTFQPLPDLPLKPLEELFRAHVLKLLVSLKLLPPERVQVLLSWKLSGFNVHSGNPCRPSKAELEKLAQYILRNPFRAKNDAGIPHRHHHLPL